MNPTTTTCAAEGMPSVSAHTIRETATVAVNAYGRTFGNNDPAGDGSRFRCFEMACDGAMSGITELTAGLPEGECKNLRRAVHATATAILRMERMETDRTRRVADCVTRELTLAEIPEGEDGSPHTLAYHGEDADGIHYHDLREVGAVLAEAHMEASYAAEHSDGGKAYRARELAIAKAADDFGARVWGPNGQAVLIHGSHETHAILRRAGLRPIGSRA